MDGRQLTTNKGELQMKLSGLKVLRKKYNISQEKLGRMVGVTGRQVSRWEAGEAFPPGKRLERLLKLFRCELHDLTGGNGER